MREKAGEAHTEESVCEGPEVGWALDVGESERKYCVCTMCSKPKELGEDRRQDMRQGKGNPIMFHLSTMRETQLIS